MQYVGVNDHSDSLFEGLFPIPAGMAYNSWVLADEKTAVMDPVGQAFADQWLAGIDRALAGGSPDILVVHHMEPDHSGSIARFMDRYPRAHIAAPEKAFPMLQAFFGREYADRRIVLREGDVLALGRRRLRFFAAPMVHWPEVMVSFEEREGTLFSADAFGRFGALDQEQPWTDEARRYYFAIVGKYGAPVQALLNKLRPLPVRRICPLHGPVLTAPLDEYLRLYDLWSRYEPEEQGTAIICASVYGNTRQAAELLAAGLESRGCRTALHDLNRGDMSRALADAFRFDRVVLAAPTCNADVFPTMKTFLHWLTARGFCGRRVGLITNGSWAPAAERSIRALLKDARELTYAENAVTLRSAVDAGAAARIDALAEELAQ